MGERTPTLVVAEQGWLLMTNRIDEILAEVRDDIRRRREAGEFAEGYEAGIESGHDAELGKRQAPEPTEASDLPERLAELQARISTISHIERDTFRFAPLRFVRELAMSRHQLIRLRNEVQGIAESFEVIAAEIVRTETTNARANLRAAEHLLGQVYERTAVMEKLVIVCRELEDRVSSLEQR